MTIELTPEQETLVRDFVESGQYESVQDFIDAAITDAYTRSEDFKQWAVESHAKAQEDIKAGRVVSVPKGKMSETLEKVRNGTLTFDR